MKYLSHLYLRTDNTLGRYPIIDVSSEGTIISIEEHENIDIEQSGVRFYGGVIVPAIKMRSLTFSSFEEFVKKINRLSNATIAVGERCELCVISGFDLRTFVADDAKVILLTSSNKKYFANS